MHNGTCVNVEEEEPEDGVCVADGTFCSAGYKQIESINNEGVVRNCLGKNEGNDQFGCTLKWEIDSTTSESCERIPNQTVCNNMYTENYDTKVKCEAAGAYWNCRQIREGNQYGYEPEIGGTCYWGDQHGNNPLSGYVYGGSESDSCQNILLENKNNCTTPMAVHCLERVTKTTTTKICKGSFNNITNATCENGIPKMIKNSGGTCGDQKYECIQGESVDNWGDDDNGYSWNCELNGKKTACYKKGNYSCHVKDSVNLGKVSCKSAPNSSVCNSINMGGKSGICVWG